MADQNQVVDPVVLSLAKKVLERGLEFRAQNADKRPGCDPEKFLDWTCCEFHTQLKLDHKNLHFLAEALEVESPGNMVCSPNWWKDFAKNFGLDVPATLTN